MTPHLKQVQVPMISPVVRIERVDIRSLSLTEFQIGQDKDIARIVEMGFSASQASHALQQSNGDVNQAIDGLLNNERKPGGGDLRRERDGRREIPSRDDRRERGQTP